MSNYQTASIRSGTRGSRRSTGSGSRPRRRPIYWAEARLTSYEPGHVLVVASDVGKDSTVLGLKVPGDAWGYEVYEAKGKNLTLGQVYMAWLQGDYALKRHAEAMNLAMLRAQRRELKDYLRTEAAGLALDSWQRELIQITLGC